MRNFQIFYCEKSKAGWWLERVIMDMLARVVRENFLECNFMSKDMDAELKLAMQKHKAGHSS